MGVFCMRGFRVQPIGLPSFALNRPLSHGLQHIYRDLQFPQLEKIHRIMNFDWFGLKNYISNKLCISSVLDDR